MHAAWGVAGRVGWNGCCGTARNYDGVTSRAHTTAARFHVAVARPSFFCQHLLHHSQFQIALCEETLETGIFLLQFAQALDR